MANFNHYKKQLIERQKELTNLIDHTKENSNTVMLDQTSVGRLSRMDAMQNQAMAKQVKHRRELDIKRIAAAIVRINEDEFGYCLTCGEEIAEKRINLDPSIALCHKCAV